MGFLARLFGRAPAAVPARAEHAEPASFWSTHAAERPPRNFQLADHLRKLQRSLPRVEATVAMDDGDLDGNGTLPAFKTTASPTSISDVLAQWYVSQGFIGHQLCAILAQHWLIDKACAMPARDAIRQGFDIINVDGDDLDPAALKLINKANREMRLAWNLEQFVRMGRIFGIRIALFKVDSKDPEYYEKPFNPDGVTPGSYRGIVQVDPYWTAPQLDQTAAANPDTMHFYEPTWWLISGKKYHRSHLVIFRNGEPPDLLKPMYLYGGVPVPQRIMERVYGAERTANEAPQLVQSKRTTVWLTNLAKFMAGGDQTIARLNDWISYRDNYSVKVGDIEGDQMQQFETSLGDLDTVIMTQYQIVAAAANVPATKLLGTTPKGFNATGEYEEANYHEDLESIQTHDMTPLIERHLLLVNRSIVVPKVAAMKGVELTVEWRPLDSPTAKELADTNLVKAQTGQQLVQSGAISSEDERQRLALDPSSGYAGVDLTAPLPDEDDDGAEGDPDDETE